MGVGRVGVISLKMADPRTGSSGCPSSGKEAPFSALLSSPASRRDDVRLPQ